MNKKKLIQVLNNIVDLLFSGIPLSKLNNY